MSATIKSFLEREKHDLSDKSNKDDHGRTWRGGGGGGSPPQIVGQT